MAKEELKAVLREKAPLFGLQPLLHQKVMDHASIRIKKDYTSKNIVLSTALSAYTDNPMNFFSRGESSIGKTYNIMNMLNYFPRKDIWLLGGLSPTALVHDYGVLIDENGDEVDEDFVEKQVERLIEDSSTDFDTHAPRKTSSQEKKDIMKRVKREWREILRNSKYLVDLSNKLLVFLENPHIETWMRLRPILSHDAPEIEYKFTDKTGGGSLRTRSVILRGWPAIICCTTDQRYIEDLATRGFSGTPETTPEKFGLANVVTGKKRARPWELDLSKDKAFHEIQAYIESVKYTLMNDCWKIVIPYAEELAKHYPAKVGRDMRDFDHFLTLIQMSTALHLFIRSRIEVEDDVWVLSNIQDLLFALKLFEDLEETTKTFLPGHVLAFFHNVVIPLTENKQTPFIEGLMDKHNETAERKISSDSVYKYVTMLSQVGYVTKESNPDLEGDKRLKVVKRLYMPKNSGYSWIPLDTPFFSIENLEKWLIDFHNNWIGKTSIIRTFSLDGERQLNVSTTIPLNVFIEKNDMVKNLFSIQFFLDKDKLEETLKKENRAETSGIQQNPPSPSIYDQIIDNSEMQQPCNSCREIPDKLYPDDSGSFLICLECKQGERASSKVIK